MQASEKQEKFFPWRWVLLWPFVIFIIYLLSFGPVWKLFDMSKPPAQESFSRDAVDNICVPWHWAYFYTPLHRPLGLYMHLWAPEFFFQDGNCPWDMTRW